jgi:hypothetical protein
MHGIRRTATKPPYVSVYNQSWLKQWFLCSVNGDETMHYIIKKNDSRNNLQKTKVYACGG